MCPLMAHVIACLGIQLVAGVAPRVVAASSTLSSCWALAQHNDKRQNPCRLGGP